MKEKKLTKKQKLLQLERELLKLSTESLRFMQCVVSESKEYLDSIRYKSESGKIQSIGICFCVHLVLRRIAFNGSWKRESRVFQDTYRTLIPRLKEYALIMYPKKICRSGSDEDRDGLWFPRDDNDIRIKLMDSFEDFLRKINGLWS